MRQELEEECDALLKERHEVMTRWAEAKVNHDNLKDFSDDLLKAIMDDIQSIEGDVPENKLTRFAKRTDKWKEHREGLKASRSLLMETKIAVDMNRKKYELAYAKYLKS